MNMEVTKKPITPIAQSSAAEAAQQSQKAVHNALSLESVTSGKKTRSFLGGKIHFVEKRFGEAKAWVRKQVTKQAPIVEVAPKLPAELPAPAMHPAVEVMHEWIDFKVANLRDSSLPTDARHVREMKALLATALETVDADDTNPFTIDIALEAGITAIRREKANDPEDTACGRFVSSLFPEARFLAKSYTTFKKEVEAHKKESADMQKASDNRMSQMHQAAEIPETAAAPVAVKATEKTVEEPAVETPAQAVPASPALSAPAPAAPAASEAETLQNKWAELLGGLKGFDNIVVNKPSRYVPRK